jgi:hypothetical protein
MGGTAAGADSYKPELRSSRHILNRSLPEDDSTESALTEETTTCVVCGIERGVTQLHRCRSCRRAYCAGCAFKSRVGHFCSKECGDIFFYGEQEDEPSEGTDESKEE